MAQSWRNLLFAHWPLPAAELRRVLPAPLPLDTYDGQAFLGIVPFQLRGLHLRWLPPLPGFSDFPELNVRTYVTIDGKPGVYFFSLDAANPLAVQLARCAHLSYFRARMRAVEMGGSIEYRSVRTHCGAGDAQLMMRYRPIGAVQPAAAGSLAAWLTERYCLYVVSPRQRVYRQDIHHGPWPLQAAEAEFSVNTMSAPLGITLPDAPPLLHFARRQDMVAFWPERVAQRGAADSERRQSDPAKARKEQGHG
jgi:uncharacterized protein YqjF (DUF2071 family)